MKRTALLTLILTASVAIGEGDKIHYGGLQRLADPYSYQLHDGTRLTFSQRRITAVYASAKPQPGEAFFYRPIPGDKISDRGAIYISNQNAKNGQITRRNLSRHGASLRPPAIQLTSDTTGIDDLVEDAKDFNRHSIGVIDFRGTVASYKDSRIYLAEIDYSIVNLNCSAFGKAAKEYWVKNEDLIKNTIENNPDIKKLFTGNGAIKVSDIFSTVLLKMQDPLNGHRFFDVHYCDDEDMVELDAPPTAGRMWTEDVKGVTWVYYVELYFLFKREPIELQEVTLSLNKARSGLSMQVPARRPVVR